MSAQAESIATSELKPVSTGVSAPISPDAARGGIYLAIRYGLGVLVGVGNMLVMTWWIGPHAYGLFVTAIAIVTVLASIARGGVDTYLVRCEAHPDSLMIGTATTLIALMSLGSTLLGAALAPLLIHWYGSREFVAPYLLLLSTIPITAMTALPMARLERALSFRPIAGIELSAQCAGLLVAAFLAWRHAGVWAPVMGQIAWQSFTLIAAAISASFGFRLSFNRQQARAMLSYGAGLTASMRTWQLRGLVNPLLVGRFAGAEAVAFVALAIRIAESLGTFRLAAGRIAIAALARLQARRDDFRKAVEQAAYLQVIILAPLLCGFALLGPLVLPRIAGARWLPSLAVYPFIALGVLVNSVYNLQASALFVIGKQWAVMHCYSIHVVILALSTFVLLPKLGIAAYGWAELLACAAYFVIHSGLAAEIEISYRKLMPWIVVSSACLFLTSASRSVMHLLKP